jgi:site-specific recombinase XerD
MLMDKEGLLLFLPCICRPEKLPMVLSKQEVKNLLEAPKHLSQKVMFGLIYDTGLRIDEFTSLLIGDVDPDRRQVHVSQSKFKKDRYVSMSEHAARGIKKHLALSNPKKYLFESSVRKGNPVSKTKIRNVLI